MRKKLKMSGNFCRAFFYATSLHQFLDLARGRVVNIGNMINGLLSRKITSLKESK
ncbi:MAG: hypothetical protein IAE93_07190 [Ignavibacteria bacterium]|nr:hypothetical protein [Ignavibacteria bacterium]